METPDRDVRQRGGDAWIETAADRNGRGEHPGPRGQCVPGADATARGAQSINAFLIDGKLLGELVNEVEEQGKIVPNEEIGGFGHVGFGSPDAAWASLWNENERRVLLAPLGTGHHSVPTAEVAEVIVADAAGAMQTHDQGIALSGLDPRRLHEAVGQHPVMALFVGVDERAIANAGTAIAPSPLPGSDDVVCRFGFGELSVGIGVRVRVPGEHSLQLGLSLGVSTAGPLDTARHQLHEGGLAYCLGVVPEGGVEHAALAVGGDPGDGLALAGAADRRVVECGGQDARLGQQVDAVIEFVVSGEGFGEIASHRVGVVYQVDLEFVPLAVAEFLFGPTGTDHPHELGPGRLDDAAPLKPELAHFDAAEGVGRSVDGDQTLSRSHEALDRLFGCRSPPGSVVENHQDVPGIQVGRRDFLGDLDVEAVRRAERALELGTDIEEGMIVPAADDQHPDRSLRRGKLHNGAQEQDKQDAHWTTASIPSREYIVLRPVAELERLESGRIAGMRLIAVLLLLVPLAAAEEGFVPLFNGKDLEGWEVDTPDLWQVRDGMIVGKSQGLKYNDFLRTKKHYGDFVLKLEFRLVDGKGNSGVQFRSKPVPGSHEVEGYQADVGMHWWGSLYDESRRRKALAGPPKEFVEALDKGGWHDYVITAKGDHIRLELDGTTTVDYHEPDPNIERTGFIALQVHSSKFPIEVQFKDIQIREPK